MRWVGPPELDLGHPVAENRKGDEYIVTLPKGLCQKAKDAVVVVL